MEINNIFKPYETGNITRFFYSSYIHICTLTRENFFTQPPLFFVYERNKRYLSITQPFNRITSLLQHITHNYNFITSKKYDNK